MEIDMTLLDLHIMDLMTVGTLINKSIILLQMLYLTKKNSLSNVLNLGTQHQCFKFTYGVDRCLRECLHLSIVNYHNQC